MTGDWAVLNLGDDGFAVAMIGEGRAINRRGQTVIDGLGIQSLLDLKAEIDGQLARETPPA